MAYNENNQDKVPVSSDDLAVYPEIDEEELAVAEKVAAESEDVFTHKFSKPVNYGNLVITELTFDFGKLTGRDGLAIENELQTLGKSVIIPALSGEYIIRAAARACDQQIGADFFEELSLKDFDKVRSAVRNFLLKAES